MSDDEEENYEVRYAAELAAHRKFLKALSDPESPRYKRARHFANFAIGIVGDVIEDEHDMREIDRRLLGAACEANVAIINVPPECDNLDLEQLLLETSRQRAGVPSKLQKGAKK